MLFFENPWHPFFTLLVIAAALALIYLSYKDVYNSISKKYALALIALRICELIILMLFILQPVVKYVSATTLKSYIAVLLDTSKSMSLTDEASPTAARNSDNSRLNKATKALTKGGVLEKLSSKGKIRFFEFSSAITEHRSDEKDLSRKISEIKEADGNTTDIVSSIVAATKEFRGQKLAGLVLLSDGQHNAGSDPFSALRGAETPVYAVGFGEKSIGGEKDIEIAEISADKRVIVDYTTEVIVTVKSKGFDNQQVPVEIVQGKGNTPQTIAKSVVKLDAAEPVQSVRLTFTPDKPGRFIFVAKTPVHPQEIISENNERSFSMNVIDPANRILYVEGTPRWEYKFLKRMLEGNPNIHLTSFVRTALHRFYAQGENLKGAQVGIPTTQEELDKFGVVIIGDVKSDLFTEEQLEGIEKLVEEGGALIMLGGNNSFGAGGYIGTPIEKILPVSITESDRYESGKFNCVLTPDGLNHPIFSTIEAEGLKEVWQNAPIILGRNIVGKPKPGATVLALSPGASGDFKDAPIIVVQNYGQGKSLAILTDSTWRWGFSTQTTRSAHTAHWQFWNQILTWLFPEEKSKVNQDKLVQLITDKDNYLLNDTVSLIAAALDETGEFIKSASVACTIKTPDEKEIRLNMKYGDLLSSDSLLKEGYSSSFVPQRSGKYKITAIAKKDQLEIGRDEISLLVGDPSIEYRNTELNDDFLRQIARITKGKYYKADQITKMPDDIKKIETKVSKTHTRKVWDSPWLFIFFMALITLEWAMRKSKQLA